MSESPSTRQSPKEDSAAGAGEALIDPALADLPRPPHHSNGASTSTAPTLAAARDASYPSGPPGQPTSISESIASAPNPHTADFSPLPFTTDDSLDPLALDTAAGDEPGSPNARLMRAIAPPNAAQPNSNWPAPPPNASVNLFIGRALLSNGNDNWPLKPNDIVSWIRKHYPDEWDGDEGRCSAHRVRTYLARKGADMYYEKLNQGCIAGWRIRQNHLWRFENGGFQGRGMKQEEAMAAQQKENEAAATAAHKAAAAAALAQGHPGIKTSMSTASPDGQPAAKRARKSNGQARRKNEKKKDDYDYGYAYEGTEMAEGASAYDNGTAPATGSAASGTPAEDANAAESSEDRQLDASMVQQAMAAANAAAAAGQMDELEMGMQLPIEMQMHSSTHDDAYEGQYGEQGYSYGGQVYEQGQ